ncbi:hypothetical protein SUGI_0765510 [Cryptomeria japonica]|nr:hypothetical protein SUGI_0765510 [Cryptomeria japonica]
MKQLLTLQPTWKHPMPDLLNPRIGFNGNFLAEKCKVMLQRNGSTSTFKELTKKSNDKMELLLTQMSDMPSKLQR